MKEPLGEPGRLSCSEAAMLLEKRFSEEALSDAEQQGVEQHLNHCRKCRVLVNWMSGLPGYADELSDDEINSAFHTMTENRSRLKRTQNRGRIAVAVVAAVATVAAVIFSGGWLPSLFPKKGNDVNEMFECSPVPPMEPVSGVVMTYCEDREPGTLIENGGDVRVSLREGIVGMLIDPDRQSKRKVTVETPQGEVRVKGTLFTVQVDGDDTRVEVFRGVVEFVPVAEGEESLQVTAGRGADLRHHTIFDLSEPKTEALRRMLDAKIERNYTAEQAPASGKALTEPTSEVTSDATESVDSLEPEGSRKPWDPVAPEKGARSGSDAPRKRSAPSIDDLIQDAQSCLLTRDWTCASSRYQDILNSYPGRPESTAVLISLAKVELRHLNVPRKALAHYKDYQQRAPNGPMAEEALFGIAETYRRLGEKDLEEEALQLFVKRYPHSSQRERARARLGQLESYSRTTKPN